MHSTVLDFPKISLLVQLLRLIKYIYLGFWGLIFSYIYIGFFIISILLQFIQHDLICSTRLKVQHIEHLMDGTISRIDIQVI